jgi:hypothetical protein
LFLVSDDSDFFDMLRGVREANLRTVVIGDWDRALGQHADLWVPWVQVQNGEVAEMDLVAETNKRRSEFLDREDELFSVTSFDGNVDNESELDSIMDELVAARNRINGVRISAFSEGEENEGEWETEEEEANLGDLVWDSEEEDGY